MTPDKSTTENVPPSDEMSAVKLALLAQNVRSQMNDAGVLGSEPIAVVGMACRFPGANSPEAFSELVRSGGDAITEVPAQRWNIDTFYDEDPFAPGQMNSRFGGFIDDLDRFDNGYFGVSPREASIMDPQQRLWLEVAVEALERAGQPVDGLGGTATGVFVASTQLDYGHHLHAEPDQVDAYTLSGNLHCIIANRLSYLLDLRGPSLSVDTACSSSLVAVHLACQSLRSHESEMAIAGAVNVLISPEPSLAIAKWGLLAADGRCKTFDDRADGFVRSEGSGAIVLKRLSTAIADGDRVLAVIRGTAVNQDGHSTTLSSPNGLAQQAVVRDALANARLGPERISCVEAHGTGTVLGDPIEVEALAAVLDSADPNDARNRAQPVALTAVKTNVGHLEAAAGMAGLIKLIVCLEAEELPPIPHFTTLNRHLSLENSRLHIPTESTPWVSQGETRVAGVSSFGFGGTNAHVIVEEAPRLPTPPASDGPHVLPLSAKSADALHTSALRMIEHLATISETDLSATCSTATLRRAHYDERLAVIGSTTAELSERLQSYLDGSNHARVLTGQRPSGPAPKVGFVFSGQGPQWWGMGRELLNSSSVFAQTIERCDTLLSAHVDWSLLAELARDETDSRLDQTEIAQPALFAIQVALAALWSERGVTPEAVLGHSVGEVAAAHVSGALSLEMAIEVVAHRGRIMQAATGTGKMASISLSASEVRERLTNDGGLTVAAVNGPSSTVVSGSTDSLDTFVETLERDQVAYQRLPVNYAFHSAQMNPHAAELATRLGTLSGTRATTTFISSVTGAVHDGDKIDAQYWATNVRQAVEFTTAIQTMADLGIHHIVEIGPHPVLAASILETLANHEPSVVASLRRNQPETETMLSATASLHCAGVDIDWTSITAPSAVTTLPTYPWQRSRFWTQKRPLGSTPAARHPLIGERQHDEETTDVIFESSISPADVVLLDHHRVANTSLMPAMGMIEMGMAAHARSTGTAPSQVIDFELIEALPLPDDRQTSIRVRLADSDGSPTFTIESKRADRWVPHARGSIGTATASPQQPAPFDRAALKGRSERTHDGDEVYANLRAHGISFGTAFQSVERIHVGGHEALSEIRPTAEALHDAAQYVFAPAVLDAALHSVDALFGADGDVILPVAMGRIDIHAPLSGRLFSHVVVRDEANLSVDAVFANEDGMVVAELTGVRLIRTDVAAVSQLAAAASESAPDPILHHVEFVPAPISGDSALFSEWLLIGGETELHERLTSVLPTGARVHSLSGQHWHRDQSLSAAIESLPADSHVVYLGGITAGTPNRADRADVLRSVLSDARHLGRSLAGSAARLTVVTRSAHRVVDERVDPIASALSAFAAGLREELAPLAVFRVDVDEHTLHSGDDLGRALANADDEELVALRSGERLAGRIRPRTLQGTTAAKRLVNPTLGTLDALTYEPSKRRMPARDEVEIEIRVTGLNFRDVLVALDMYPEPNADFGQECSGVVTAVGLGVERWKVGDRVMAATPDSFGTHVTTHAELIASIPDGWSFDAAASVSITFLTALHSLVELGHMSPGERVLIHSGAGGVGLAAIQLAQHYGATVFATAGSPGKRELLKSLGVENVFDSRSLEFADGVMAATNGEGVDLVLNSLADDFIDASVSVLAQGGRFLEIGKRGIWSHEQMSAARPDVEYHIIYLGGVAQADPSRISTLFDDLLPLFASGALRPLPLTVFAANDVADAFRFMAQARHIGKVVIHAPPPHGLTIDPDAMHVITGGSGGIGLVSAQWLADSGASHIALLSRSEPTGEAADTIASLRARGIEVRTDRVDVSDAHAVTRFFTELNRPVGGIIHAAGVIADGLLANTDTDSLEVVLNPKTDGADNLLDALTNHDPDWMLLMSAASTLLGSAGQVNYSAANGYLDGLVDAAEFPIISIGWGPWDDVGMTATLDAASIARMGRRGWLPIIRTDAVAAMERALAMGADAHHHLGLSLDVGALEDRPLFRTFVAEAPATNDAVTLLDTWTTTTPSLRRPTLKAFVADQARRVLGLSADAPIESRTPFNEIGLDSLMAVELRNGVGSAIGEVMPATLLFDYPTADALVEYLLELVANRSPQDAEPTSVDSDITNAAVTNDVADVASLSDAEAEAALIAELERGSAS